MYMKKIFTVKVYLQFEQLYTVIDSLFSNPDIGANKLVRSISTFSERTFFF